MKALLIAAILVIGTIAVQEEGMETIQKLERSKSGKTILDTIALQLAAGDPADDLVIMLQDEEDRLEREQDKDDDLIVGLQNQCVVDLATYVDEIADTRKRIQELDDLLEELKPIKADKEDERAELQAFQALIEKKLKEIAEAKVAKDAEWEEERAAHDSQSAIISKAKDIIVGGLSAGFLQSKAKMTQVLVQVSQHFNNAKKLHFKRKGLTSIFRMLAQISASQEIQADDSAVQKIVDICDELLEKIAESRNIEKTDYDHWVTEYVKTKTQLTDKLNATKAAITQLNLEISTLAKKIGNAASELAEQKVRLEQKITQHDERENFCDDAATRYATDREARSDQREIISDAIGLITSKIRLLKRYVTDRVQTLERPV